MLTIFIQQIFIFYIWIGVTMITTVTLVFACFVISSWSEETIKCTEYYSLYPRKNDSLNFLESIIAPIPIEKFFVDILHKSPAVLRRKKKSSFEQIINMNNIDEILQFGRKHSNPNVSVEYGDEWKLAKRINQGGEWWTGMFKSQNVSVTSAKDAFATGFSLIINTMQSLWPTIFKSAWLLEDALGWRVNVNLYMSPRNSQGFEAHFDWMDGFVLQVQGKKNWIIYDPVMMVYPRPDMVEKPFKSYLKDEKVEKQCFSLEAGDIAYIPRGVVHEATTKVPNGCKDSDGLEALDEPSLHLTYGVETATHFTVEVIRGVVTYV